MVSGELLVRVDLALKERFAGAAARASSAAADAAEGGGSLQPAASSPRAAPAMQARAPLTRAPHARDGQGSSAPRPAATKGAIAGQSADRSGSVQPAPESKTRK